jgi:hypothetical protein
MQQALDMLLKAGQWNSQRDEEIRFLIESRSYDVAEQRIAELRELLAIWEGTEEYKERLARVQALEKTLSTAQTPAPAAPSAATTIARAPGRPQSRLRIDNTDGILRDAGGLFGQLRQNIGR